MVRTTAKSASVFLKRVSLESMTGGWKVAGNA
jgi:hypothetical protein